MTGGKNAVDRKARTIMASWPITLGKTNVPMAIDEAHHLLFVSCRNGQIVIFDTKELEALPLVEVKSRCSN
jgi:hypothetical protein